ncbi:hypothetical protein FRC14_005452 [Serendipita sp. 396]|nr:hypothetical protein FRC14_005452 [Serendipita sp. 396]KAG8780513.1 hypothetical protein FRC15_009522 [Serendipita sp. 397]KAG8797785.1 hypothetical protein FRC16_008525 [Serendipita sp. 398]KAG8854395.1 hypothetical protein FRB91_003526 [Serendipita sp. 411]KAG8867072.1 hypothetical protein FRC20_006774 [Serendipita sp. 405]KAG9053825.1 hypothetical protein FS842_007037 [Serendipita sp. 407]
MANRTAAFNCGVCLENLVEGLGVLECGHVVCNNCLNSLNDQARRKNQRHKECPYCRKKYTTEPYPLYPDLCVTSPSPEDVSVLYDTRQRVVHLINELSVASSPEEIRHVYEEARKHRASIRNIASASHDKDLNIWALAITDAVDSLEDKLHYSLQKQDLANKVKRTKKELETQAQMHRYAVEDLQQELASMREMLTVAETRFREADTRVKKYKHKADAAASEQVKQAMQASADALRLQELQKELEKVKKERNLFQTQLTDHKSADVKRRAQLNALKQENNDLREQVEGLKSKTAGKPRPLSLINPSSSPSVIDLSNFPSSPVVVPSRKRSRPANENKPHLGNEIALLPPTKVRVGGPSRAPNECVEVLHFSDGGNIKRKAIKTVPKSTESSGPKRPTTSKPETLRIQLGDGGKQMVPIKKRAVKAV